MAKPKYRYEVWDSKSGTWVVSHMKRPTRKLRGRKPYGAKDNYSARRRD